MFQTIQGNLTADVAASGSFTVAYPTGLNSGHFKNAVRNVLVLSQSTFNSPADFTLTFGTSSISVTNGTSAAWVAGSAFFLQLDLPGIAPIADPATAFVPINTRRSTVHQIDLGAASLGSAALLALTQTLSTGGIAALTTRQIDVPRNIVASWSTASVLTLTGTDAYGVTITEQSASGTSHTGTKAFKTLTSASFSSAAGGVTVGTGNALGLPAFLPNTGNVLQEMIDGAKASTAGTYVAGVPAKATSTTGDVRGSYTPFSTTSLDGLKSLSLIAALPDVGFKGVTQA
jgi:hypothetical protein